MLKLIIVSEKLFKWILNELKANCESSLLSVISLLKEKEKWKNASSEDQLVAMISLSNFICFTGDKNLLKQFWIQESMSDIYKSYFSKSTITNEWNIIHYSVSFEWKSNTGKHLRFLLTKLKSLHLLPFLLHQQCGKQGITPLHLSAKNQNILACKILLLHNADPTSRDLLNNIPLHYSTSSGNQCTHILMKAMPVTYSPFKRIHKFYSTTNLSCLHMAAYSNQPLAVSTLLTYCKSYNINHRDNHKVCKHKNFHFYSSINYKK